MKGKNLIKICLVSLMLGIFVFQAPRIEAYAQDNVSDVMDLSGITRDKTGKSVVKKTYVTREEFAQMVVQASQYNEEVENSTKIKLFKDVNKNSNKAAYIQLAVTKGYMSGYLGGMFKPQKAVTLKEAIYSSLALLQYTTADFKGNISDARFDKFKELGLYKNLTRSEESKLTKKDCETLFYNLLNAKNKTGEVYAKTLGYSINEEGKIDYAAIFTKKAEGPIITNKGWEKKLSRKLSTYYITKNNKKVSSSSIEDGGIAYYCEHANRIWIYKEKVFGTLDNIAYNQTLPQELTIAGINYTIDNPTKMSTMIKDNNIKKGMLVVALLGKDDKAAYVLPIKSTLANGNWEQKITFKMKDGTIYKNDKKADASKIKNCDLLYYCNNLKSIWAYDKKVFGSLDTITLNQGEPLGLTVSGESYTVQDSQDMKKQINNSSIKTGMPVVILLGWDKKVSKVIPLSTMVAGGDWQQKITFNADNGSIYKNGSVITSTNIESSDVMYYSDELQSIWVYTKKVYGVIKTISPNLSTPDQIIVAGNTYDLKMLPIDSSSKVSTDTDNPAENAWGKRIRENGIREGDNVVVLFGYNGKVADIIPVEKMPVTIGGYVLEVKTNLVKDANNVESVKRVVSFVDTEGIIREFPCADSTVMIGSIVEVNFQNNSPVVTKVDYASYINRQNEIKTRKIAEGARIISVSIDDLSYKKISSSDFKSIPWTVGNLYYYRLNSFGEISDLIIHNVSSAIYQYGFLVKITATEAGVEVVVNIGGTERKMITGTYSGSSKVGPKAILMEGDSIKEMRDLEEVKISYINGKQAIVGDSVYQITDEVAVYYYINGEYYKKSLDDITDFSKANVKGYTDQSQQIIRAIVVTE